MTTNRQQRRLAEQGRRLASERDNLISAGVDPAELPVPLYPVPAPSGRIPRHPDLITSREYTKQLVLAWVIVAAACLGALAGCVSATGAMLVVSQEWTWHAWVSSLAGLGWFVGMIWSAAYAGRLHRDAREDTSA